LDTRISFHAVSILLTFIPAYLPILPHRLFPFSPSLPTSLIYQHKYLLSPPHSDCVDLSLFHHSRSQCRDPGDTIQRNLCYIPRELHLGQGNARNSLKQNSSCDSSACWGHLPVCFFFCHQLSIKSFLINYQQIVFGDEPTVDKTTFLSPTFITDLW
jgi:hypothetical protein